MSISAFVHRQSEAEATFEQKLFDVVFGLIAPLGCVYFDPIVFTGDSFFGSALLGDLKFIGYVGIALGWISLASAIWTSSRSVLLAGSLLGTACIAALIGFLILPMSILGIPILGIGLLGFLPFVTSLVLIRNALRVAARLTDPADPLEAPPISLGIGVALLVLLSLGQFGVNKFVDERIDLILTGDKETAERAGRQLSSVSIFADLEGLVTGYESIEDEEKLEQVADIYLRLTGEWLENRLAIMND